MSKEELAGQINEENLGNRTNSVWGLLAALAVKYGLPSLCCAYLFYVVSEKDQIIYTMAKDTTAALVSSTAATKDNSEAINNLATAVNGLKARQ